MALHGNSQKTQNVDEIVDAIKIKYKIVGRDKELKKLVIARIAKMHALIEGPVGVGKTTLAAAIADYFDQRFIRVDGDERFTESKMVGFFDPPLVISKGWSWDSFIPGPLTKAMREGGILLLNEVNRLPEGTQNALLPALDEGIIEIPKLGELQAKDGFMVIATQNPEEYVGTSVLSEALKDRFVWIPLSYQSEEEEMEITKLRSGISDENIVKFAVSVVRATRKHPDISRGASVRGAIDIARMFKVIKKFDLPTAIDITIASIGRKIELEESCEDSVETVLENIVRDIFAKNF